MIFMFYYNRGFLQVCFKTLMLLTCFFVDCGLVVPAVSYPLRQRLLDAAEAEGLSTERQLEMIGRSACEMVMQLLGGAHR